MQRGRIWKENKSWMGRWWETRLMEDGSFKRVQPSRKLAPYCDRYRTESDVRPLLDEIMRPLNQGGRNKFNQQLEHYVENVYLPHVEQQKRKSTELGYREKWRNYLKPLAADIWLRDVRTSDVQQMLNTIAKRHPKLRRTTLQRCKSVLSAVFSYAKRMGDFDGVNPVVETEIPSSAKASGETHAYSINDINAMLLALPSPAHEIVAVASYAGLSRSEIEGLCWENYTGNAFDIVRGRVHGVFGEPKTEKRKALVPVIPRLRKVLDKYRLTLGNPSSGVMFANAKKKNPVSLNNLSNRVIIPALNRCVVCGKPDDEKHHADHKFERDASLPQWCGYHACRRGLATNLHDLGVDDITIMRILRHSSVEVTRRSYIKTLPQQVTDAMTKLDAKLGTIQ